MFHLSRQGPRMRAGFDLGPATGDQLRAVFLEEAVQHRTTIHPGAIFDPGRRFSDENAQNGPANGVSTRPRGLPATRSRHRYRGAARWRWDRALAIPSVRALPGGRVWAVRPATARA